LLSALKMDDHEQERRMQTMRAVVRGHDVFNWACSFIRDAAISGTEMTPAVLRASGD
jgi:trehalose-6-phosphate synthase